MHKKPKAIVIGLIDRDENFEKQQSSLEEAGMLVETYGGDVVSILTQNASHLNGSTYIGSGKVQELASRVEEENIQIVVINTHLRAGQLHKLQQEISPDEDCSVWDRTQLILQIFKNHASTAEAKLQIKLAELNHRGPELSGIGLTMSQQAGGIGARGMGETQTEIMQRHWRKETKTLEGKLEKTTQNRQQQMNHRKLSGVPTVSIVGYTNAGKTTLFNLLGNKEDKIQDALFATLDSSISSLYLQNVGKEIFISDTIGFIQDLPTELIQAFKSTLLETINADLLLHVVDGSDENMAIKIDTVNSLIASLNLQDQPQLYVINKADKLSQDDKEKISKKLPKDTHIYISAKENQEVDDLILLIEKQLVSQGLKRAKHLAYLDQL